MQETFKKSHGYKNNERINIELMKGFSLEEKELHQKILTWRDQEYAHSDSEPNDIQIDETGGYSRRVVRQLLEKVQLEMLKTMVNKIREEIESLITKAK